ncbi:hypothetical protein MHU86_22961 [Fragilaria crotonensis]|nr:hypothetical protein MHU86_22961 [Fragilaria crotonensis]
MTLLLLHPKGDRGNNRGTVMQEKTLKFRFPPPTSNNSAVNPLLLHTHWMHEVKTAYGDGVVFLDNNNRKIDKLDPLRTTSESPTYYFSVKGLSTSAKSPESQANNTTRFIIHRIQSKHSLSEI